MDDLLTQEDVAKIFNVTPSTIKNWRCKHKKDNFKNGLRFIKINYHHVRYKRKVVEEYYETLSKREL